MSDSYFYWTDALGVRHYGTWEPERPAPKPLKLDVPEYDVITGAGFREEWVILFGLLAMFALGVFIGVMVR